MKLDRGIYNKTSDGKWFKAQFNFHQKANKPGHFGGNTVNPFHWGAKALRGLGIWQRHGDTTVSFKPFEVTPAPVTLVAPELPGLELAPNLPGDVAFIGGTDANDHTVVRADKAGHKGLFRARGDQLQVLDLASLDGLTDADLQQTLDVAAAEGTHGEPTTATEQQPGIAAALKGVTEDDWKTVEIKPITEATGVINAPLQTDADLAAANAAIAKYNHALTGGASAHSALQDGKDDALAIGANPHLAKLTAGKQQSLLVRHHRARRITVARGLLLENTHELTERVGDHSSPLVTSVTGGKQSLAPSEVGLAGAPGKTSTDIIRRTTGMDQMVSPQAERVIKQGQLAVIMAGGLVGSVFLAGLAGLGLAGIEPAKEAMRRRRRGPGTSVPNIDVAILDLGDAKPAVTGGHLEGTQQEAGIRRNSVVVDNGEHQLAELRANLKVATDKVSGFFKNGIDALRGSPDRPSETMYVGDNSRTSCCSVVANPAKRVYCSNQPRLHPAGLLFARLNCAF